MTALVLLPKSRYRDIAQQNWRLTDEQMKGMHVHHRIPRSKGGTDAPENLYVCSPWFHAEVWHQGRYRQIVVANDAAVSGGLTNKNLHQKKKKKLVTIRKTLTENPTKPAKIMEAFQRLAKPVVRSPVKNEPKKKWQTSANSVEPL